MWMHTHLSQGSPDTHPDNDQSTGPVHDRWPPHQLQPGQAYEINNQKKHSVMNKGEEDRITFIFDYVPPQDRP